MDEKQTVWVGGAKKRQPHLRHKNTYLIITVVVALALLVTALFINRKRQSTAVNHPVCSDVIVAQASPLLDLSKLDQLRPVAETIQKQKDFDRDPNCLYILVAYYINSQDALRARTDLNKLKRVYPSKQGLSPLLGTQVRGLEALENDVSFLEQRAKTAQQNTLTFPNPQ